MKVRAEVETHRRGFSTRWAAGPCRPADPAMHAADAVAQAEAMGGGELTLWVERVDDTLDAAAHAAGFHPWRDLLQLRCPLPAAPSDLPVRAFTEDDAEAFLAVNNRAFAWHPEQGGMTLDDLRSSMAEPWFDPAGFLLHERDGRLAGFCWTKIHAADPAIDDPPMGEIYVIAVDPDFHGHGIGGPLTLAGLGWLASKGLGTGMLYVESDNQSAVRTYERIGFTVHHVDRAYRRQV
ncbi:MAG TPA: mycothiol synthase [Acidimicrobiales bacterium]|jgi:mycothiol synthase|nr:mycothiol synthase [Acidimicrobiales bacterium]